VAGLAELVVPSWGPRFYKHCTRPGCCVVRTRLQKTLDAPGCMEFGLRSESQRDCVLQPKVAVLGYLGKQNRDG
jgi:hypothetical protein